LYIKALQSGVAYVYTIMGHLITVVSYHEGEATVSLPQGLYIVRTETKTTKIVVRQ
jgi:hypothetical protein